MKVLKAFLILAVSACICVTSCKKNKQPASIPSGEVYLDLPETTDEYYVHSNSTVNTKATIGRVLFYDTHLSLNNSVSCATCHKQELAFADDVAFSNGFENRPAGRNTPPIQNLSDVVPSKAFTGNSTPLFWDGRERNILNLVARPISNHVEMGMDLNELPDKLSNIGYYNDLFKEAYGDATISTYRISECISFFMCAMTANHTRFDDYMNEGESVLNAIELQGLHLFHTTYKCSNCHNLEPGSYIAEDFIDIGLDAEYKDKGAGAITRLDEDNGTFKTPNLRNVAVTAPYMHDGRFSSLRDVLDHYSKGIKNSQNLSDKLKDDDGKPMHMNISDQDKEAIIAFLNTLTDHELLTDSKFSNPFKVK